MSFSIRLAEKSDAEAWARMRVSLWEDLADELNQKEIDKMLDDVRSTNHLVVDSTNKPIGFAEIYIRDYANGCTQQPVPFLEGIWIDAQHRRSGVGRELISRITEDLKAQGYVELCSDILETNHQSHRAHENWGFEETERVIYFRKGLD
ncbi:MAG: GNAT family N-acetyltransferase [Rhizobiaceae bacterium]|nr:GNAT family N-acetyltransferase [Hyphomicrobiales bacterium]NRB29139.1 GNAT family N-acetyltransferase [Rhizobiaceae bacterium]